MKFLLEKFRDGVVTMRKAASATHAGVRDMDTKVSPPMKFVAAVATAYRGHSVFTETFAPCCTFSSA